MGFGGDKKPLICAINSSMPPVRLTPVRCSQGPRQQRWESSVRKTTTDAFGTESESESESEITAIIHSFNFNKSKPINSKISNLKFRRPNTKASSDHSPSDLQARQRWHANRFGTRFRPRDETTGDSQFSSKAKVSRRSADQISPRVKPPDAKRQPTHSTNRPQPTTRTQQRRDQRHATAQTESTRQRKERPARARHLTTSIHFFQSKARCAQ